jgi:hypothetical protein
VLGTTKRELTECMRVRSLGYCAASCGNCLPTFRDNVSVPSSRVKSPRRKESQQRVAQNVYGKVRGGGGWG